MASGSKDEKGRAPALDDVKTEREAEAVARAREAGAATGNAAVPTTPAADSPKPHGDKLEKAVKEAARTPSEDKG